MPIFPGDALGVTIEGRVWAIPAERMKMKRPHRVPLSSQAIRTLGYLRKITGGAKLVFPSTRSVLRPLSENTLNAALRRLGYGPDQVTVHGFRTTASTRLNEMGRWNPDASSGSWLIKKMTTSAEPTCMERTFGLNAST
jgi:integrase